MGGRQYLGFLCFKFARSHSFLHLSQGGEDFEKAITTGE